MYGQIYLITNTVNGKRYVGQACDPERRWQNHKSAAARGTNKALYNAMRKYGTDSFSFETLGSAPDPKTLTAAEQAFIFFYESLDPSKGYNRREAGPTGNFGEESRKKMSAWQVGRKLTPEHCQNISKANKGLQVYSEERRKRISGWMTGHSYNLGTHWSEEAKLRRRGHKKSPETRAKMSAYQLSISAEKSARMSGEGNPFFGKKHSEETKRKISEARLRRKAA